MPRLRILSCLVLVLPSATAIAAPRRAEFSQGSEGGIRLSILLDTSASMEDMAQNVRAAAVELVQSLGEHDLGRIVTFGGKVETIRELTSNREQLSQAILGIQAWSGTSALYNALFLYLKYSPPGEESARPLVVVVMSDGKDTSSRVTRDQLKQAAENATARIYSILLPTLSRGPRRGGDRFLKSLAESTDGEAYEPENATELRSAVQSLAKELKRLSSLE